MLASHPVANLERFERALARAREAYPAWEGRVWWTQSVQTALLRYLGLEIGRRLVDRGQIATVEDVFFLEATDARSAASSNDRAAPKDPSVLAIRAALALPPAAGRRVAHGALTSWRAAKRVFRSPARP